MEASESTSAEAMEGEVSSSTSQAISRSEEASFDIIEQSSVENEEVILDDLPDTSAPADVWETVEDDGLVAHTEAQQSGVSDCNDDSEPFAVSALGDINTVSSESFDTLSEEVIPMPSIGDNNELDFLRGNILISTTSEEIIEFGSPNNIIVEQSIEMSTSDGVDNEEVVECSLDDYSHPQSSSFNVIAFGPSNSQPSTSHDITIYTSNPDSTTFESSSRQSLPTSSNAEVSTTDEETSQVSTSYANPASNNPTTSESTLESSQNCDEVSSINVQTSPSVSQTLSVCTSSTTAGKEPARRPNLGITPQSSRGPSQSEQQSVQNSNMPLVESKPTAPKADPVSSTKDADNNPSTSNSNPSSQESQIGTSTNIQKVTAKQLSEAIDNLAPCSSSMLTIEGQNIVSSVSADSEDSSSGSNSVSNASSNVKSHAAKSRNLGQGISIPSSSGTTAAAEKSPIGRNPIAQATTAGSNVLPATPGVVKTPTGTRVKLVRHRLTKPEEKIEPAFSTKPAETHHNLPKIVPSKESIGKVAVKDVAVSKPDGTSTSDIRPTKPAAKLSALDAIKAAYAMQESAATNSDSDDSNSDSDKDPKETEKSEKSPSKELPKSVELVMNKPLKPIEVSSTSVVKPVEPVQHVALASVSTIEDKPTETVARKVQKNTDSNDCVDGHDIKRDEGDVNVAGPSQTATRTEIDAAHPRFLKTPEKKPIQAEAPKEQTPPEPPKEKKPSFAKSLADKIGKLISKVVSPKSDTKVTPFSFTSQPASSSGEDVIIAESRVIATKVPDPPKVEKLTLKLQKDTTLYASTSATVQSTESKQSSSNAGQETLVSSGTFEEPKVEKLTLKLNKDLKPESSRTEAGRTPEATIQPKITLKLKKDPATSHTVVEPPMDVDQDGKQSEIVSSSAREEPKVGKITLKLKKDSLAGPQEKITLKLKKNLVTSEASTSETISDNSENSSKLVKAIEEEKKVEKLTLKLKSTEIAAKSTDATPSKKEEKHDKITLTLKKDPVTSELLVSDKSTPMEIVSVQEMETKHEKLMLKLRKDPITSEITNLQDKSSTDSNKQVEGEEKHEKITLKLKKDPVTSELVSEKVSDQISSKQQSSSKNIDASELVANEPKVAKLTLKLKKDHDGLSHSPDRKVSTPEALISPRTAFDSHKPEEKVEKITLTLKKDAATSEIIAEKKLSKKEPLRIDVSDASDESHSHKEEPKLVEKLTLKLKPSSVKPGEQCAEVLMASPKEVSKLDKITLRLTKDTNTSEIIAEKLPKKHVEEALSVNVSSNVSESSSRPSPKEPSKLDKITIKLTKDDTGEIVQTDAAVEEPKLVEKLTLKLKPSAMSPVGPIEIISDKSSSSKPSKDLASKLDKITLRLSKDATKRAEIVETCKDASNPGSPSVLQEQEKIKLTFKKDAAWSVQKTKIKSKDSENSQSSQDEGSVEIIEAPRKFETSDNATESAEKFHETASVTKFDDNASTSKPPKSLKRTLDKTECPSKPPKISSKNFGELSVTIQDAKPERATPEQQLRVMLAKIGTTATTLGSDLSVTLTSSTKVSPRQKTPKEPKGMALNDDVEIIQVAGPSSVAVQVQASVNLPETTVPQVPLMDSFGMEPKPKKPRGRPRKQALVAVPTPPPSHAVPGQVTAPVAVAATSAPAKEVKREILRPKRSCRGEDPVPPVPKEKKPRKPRVMKKKRGGWRGTGGKKVTTPKGKAKAEPLPAPMPEAVQNFEEETRMEAEEAAEEVQEVEEVEEVESPPEPAPPVVVVLPPVVALPELPNEESQGSVVSTSTNATTTPSLKKEKAGRMEIELSVHKEVTVEQIAEYQWPSDKTGEHYMIQEQISEYLKVKSFKRKYPDLTRRPVEMEERTFLSERGLVTESMCDLGLTAVSSAEVLDIMYSDFQEKYEEYRRYLREKQAKEFTTRQKAVQATSNSSERKLDFKEKAVQSAADWNSTFNRTRKDKRRCVFDLQSFTIHFPQAKRQRMAVKPQASIGHYPVSLIPGQYTDFYKSYTPAELRYFPLNTVLYGPLKPNERQQPGAPGCSDDSQSDSDDSSSSDDSSDSSSEGTQDTEETNSLAGDADPSEVKPEPPVKEELSREGAVCKVCAKDKNKEGADEVLIHCAQCTTSVHPSCLDLTLDMVPHIRRYDWQCTDCKTCILCKDPADEDKMLFCDMCDRGYHIYCVGLRRVPTGRWHCKECAVCGSCGALEPGGTSDTGSAMWQHEYKKGEKGARVYAQTLCIPCSKLWRKGRYCQLCWRCYGFRPEDEEGLISCSICERWMHSECCNTVGGAELDRAATNFVCDLCQEKSHPRPSTKLVRHTGKV